MLDPLKLEEHEELLHYPTVERFEDGINCFAVPPAALMTKEVLAFDPCSEDVDTELHARWAARLREAFTIGEDLAVKTLEIARDGDDVNWGLGKILRAAVEAEREDSLEYVARGFIHMIVAAAISGRAPLTNNQRLDGDQSRLPAQ
jgi:hypothetical protein